MSSISWWRSWHGAPTDHKWQVISARSGVKVGIVSAIAWALIDYASQQPERGSVEGFDVEEYSVYSGFDETEVMAVITAMTDKGIITDGKLKNWEKRQPKREDDSTPRVREWRASKRNVTQGNAPDKDKEEESDQDPDEEEREEVEKISTPAPAPVRQSGDGVVRIFSKVTGMAAIPGTEVPRVLQAMDGLSIKYPNEVDLVKYLRPFWYAWTKRMTKDKRPYPRTNCAWLYDWAIGGSIPIEGNGGTGAPVDNLVSQAMAIVEERKNGKVVK